MRFDTLQGERNLGELTRRLFQIDESRGIRNKELAKQAEATLLRANPHLQDIKNLSTGTLIIVPEVEGIKVAPAATAEASSSGINQEELTEQLRQTLSTARDALETSLKRETEETRNMVKGVEDHELRELAQRIPELQERLSRIAEEGKAHLQDIDARRASQKQGLAQLEKDFKEFIRLISIQ